MSTQDLMQYKHFPYDLYLSWPFVHRQAPKSEHFHTQFKAPLGVNFNWVTDGKIPRSGSITEESSKPGSSTILIPPTAQPFSSSESCPAHSKNRNTRAELCRYKDSAKTAPKARRTGKVLRFALILIVPLYNLQPRGRLQPQAPCPPQQEPGPQ